MATQLNLRVGTARSTAITGRRVIAPELPLGLRRSLPAPVEPEPAATLPAEDQCPECGDELIFGRTSLQGVEVRVRFCRNCAYREEFCPICEGEIAVEAGEVYCLECNWREQAG